MRLFLSALCIVGFACLSVGCVNSRDTLLREDLFKLEIGKLEGEINLYDAFTQDSVQKPSLAFRDGLFYISDSAGQNITRYNSYGDLLFMIYNDETHPALLELQNLDAPSPAITRWAVPYPLQNPGAIYVDKNKHLYVADRLDLDRRRYDDETGILYDSILLHFDANGRFIEYLGRQGKGGSPFPHIESIFISKNEDVAVVCRGGAQFIVYWFSKDNRLEGEFNFSNYNMPQPEGREDLLVSLDSIAVAEDEKIIYIKADYYRAMIGETTEIFQGGVPDTSSIWAFSVENNNYLFMTEVPFYENVSSVKGKRVVEELFYSMLGVLPNREVLFYFPTNEGYLSMSLKAGERNLRKKRELIRVNNEELEYGSFTVTPNGIIAALLASEWEARVVWWRRGG